MLVCLEFSPVEMQITEERFGGEVTDFLFYLVANERNHVPPYWQVRYSPQALARYKVSMSQAISRYLQHTYTKGVTLCCALYARVVFDHRILDVMAKRVIC